MCFQNLFLLCAYYIYLKEIIQICTAFSHCIYAVQFAFVWLISLLKNVFLEMHPGCPMRPAGLPYGVMQDLPLHSFYCGTAARAGDLFLSLLYCSLSNLPAMVQFRTSRWPVRRKTRSAQSTADISLIPYPPVSIPAHLESSRFWPSDMPAALPSHGECPGVFPGFFSDDCTGIQGKVLDKQSVHLQNLSVLCNKNRRVREKTKKCRRYRHAGREVIHPGGPHNLHLHLSEGYQNVEIFCNGVSVHPGFSGDFGNGKTVLVVFEGIHYEIDSRIAIGL